MITLNSAGARFGDDNVISLEWTFEYCSNCEMMCEGLNARTWGNF